METLFTAREIAERVSAMGREIRDFYQAKPLTLLVIANGAIFFGADLARAIDLPLWVDVLPAGSYAGHRSTGRVRLRGEPKLPVAGRHLLLVDEVLDTGITLRALTEHFADAGALSVRTAVMITKKCSRPDGIARADWSGFDAPDRYLVGYGMDSHEEFRNLPDIGVIEA